MLVSAQDIGMYTSNQKHLKISSRSHNTNHEQHSVLPKGGPLALSALSDLTTTYWLAGDRKASMYYGERAVNGLTKTLGPDDPITLIAIFHLART